MKILQQASSFTLAVALVAAALGLSLMLPVVAHATTTACADGDRFRDVAISPTPRVVKSVGDHANVADPGTRVALAGHWGGGSLVPDVDVRVRQVAAQ